MFVTKASRHDRSDIEEFLSSEGTWESPDIGRGTAFVAREGVIVGHARLIELAPTTLVVEQVLVRPDKRRQGIGTRVMEAAMNNKGGKLFVACDAETAPFFERFGFSPTSFDDLPAEVQQHHSAAGAGSELTYMTAR